MWYPIRPERHATDGTLAVCPSTDAYGQGAFATQAARLDDLLPPYGSSKSVAKGAVLGVAVTMADLTIVTVSGEVLKNVTAGNGLKSHEIGSHKVPMAWARPLVPRPTGPSRSNRCRRRGT